MFSITHLNAIRAAEVERVTAWLPTVARVLEIGAGTGEQAKQLAGRGLDVTAIEIPDSTYAQARVFPIIDYDGYTIPFPDHCFDIVFSSNVLEHIVHLAQLHREIRRVLRPDGRVLHVLPTHAWRFWSTISAFPLSLQYVREQRPRLRPLWPPRREHLRRLRQGLSLTIQSVQMHALHQMRHGERGNVISETWFFHPAWWRRNFRDNGFEIVRDAPMGLFYTGNMIFADRWSMATRARVARVCGSACRIFELRPRES